MRVDTQTILSIHHNVITQNPRIILTHNDHRSWYLHIREVEESDRGWYMCQVCVLITQLKHENLIKYFFIIPGKHRSHEIEKRLPSSCR